MVNCCVKPGMLVEEVNEVISFRQNIWLKTYIVFFTGKRAVEKHGFYKDLPKFMNCSFYSKTMENVRNKVKTEMPKES